MLPQFGFAEFLVLAIVALVVVGPRELPLMLRRVGGFWRQMRSMGREFQRSFEEIGRETELNELRREVRALRDGDLLGDDGLADVGRSVRDAHADARSALHGDGVDDGGDVGAGVGAPAARPLGSASASKRSDRLADAQSERGDAMPRPKQEGA